MHGLPLSISRVFALFLAVPLISFAQLVSPDAVIVSEPVKPHIYFGELTGTPHIFRIESTEPFPLYVRLLVPDEPEANRSITAEITEAGVDAPLSTLDGAGYDWEETDEPLSGTPYLRGPEFERDVQAGVYEVRVGGAGERGPYGLAIGRAEIGELGYPSALCVFLSIIVVGFVIVLLMLSISRARSGGSGGGMRDDGEDAFLKKVEPRPPLPNRPEAPKTAVSEEGKHSLKDQMSKPASPPGAGGAGGKDGPVPK